MLLIFICLQSGGSFCETARNSYLDGLIDDLPEVNLSSMANIEPVVQSEKEQVGGKEMNKNLITVCAPHLNIKTRVVGPPLNPKISRVKLINILSSVTS